VDGVPSPEVKRHLAARVNTSVSPVEYARFDLEPRGTSRVVDGEPFPCKARGLVGSAEFFETNDELAFGAVEPSGKRLLVAVDSSGSMTQ